MSTNSQIRQIHTLKNLIGLSDETYRDMLASFGVCSSKDLTITEAKILIEILNDNLKSSQKQQKKYDDFYGRNSKMATPLQLRKIEVMWYEIRTDNTKQKSLREFLQKHFHVDDLRFMTKIKASRIIAVMEKIKFNQCLKAV